ncbi:class I SAM-dependent methyltransferase [Catenuloplanes japonicus]|uniref:class I SAM-dependent methyltransferase n=1 Tax=Catenuloplanes japonicus TaxID=33876 RepID=UPI00052524CC|nr:class I SAM-dependent methyltransferase [Catenuloplanes japonicus]
MATSPYTFDNDTPTASRLLTALGQMMDPFTRRRLGEAVDLASARCLEVGAGAGTVALWLAEQGADVIATDIKPQHVPAHPRLTVLEHDIVHDPLPDGPFDLIHVRAVLAHLPQREQVLARLARALAPGGTLVIEEMEARWGVSVLAAADENLPGIMERYEPAMLAVLRGNGQDPAWSRRVFTAMAEAGLTDVGTEGWHGSSAGGTGACLLAWSGSTELRPRLIATGLISAADLDALAAAALDPGTVLRGTLLLSTAGRSPS